MTKPSRNKRGRKTAASRKPAGASSGTALPFASGDGGPGAVSIQNADWTFKSMLNCGGSALLFGIGYTMIQIAEFGLAELSFVLGLVAALYSLKVSNLKPTTRAILCILVSIWTLFFCVVTYQIKGGKGWSNLTTAVASPEFHVTKLTSLVTVGRLEPTEFAAFNLIGKKLDGSYAIEPIPFLMVLAITNTADKPVTIFGLSAEAKGSIFWHKMCYLPVMGRKLLSLSGTNGVEFSASNALETSLIGQTIDPNRTVKGWIALRCEKREARCGDSDIRIKALSANGSVFIQDLPKSLMVANMTATVFDREGVIDMTKVKYGFEKTHCE
jgi:hypothetical protein